ncbi:MAG: apolipoprotein N-acyltransferase [Methylotenera sp.]|nr:apolipoprotein N-acyltransferase [Methylotenera sp.]
MLKSSVLFNPLCLFLLGATCVLGFAPFYLYPLSLISLASLCYVWRQCDSPKQAALAGFFYGLGLFCLGIYWIYISLHDFGHMPAWMAALATLLLCGFMALFPALVGWLSLKVTQSQSTQLLMAVPVWWALADWTRSWIFTGFPWLSIGYSQVPASPLAGFMPILGVYGVTLITVAIACAMAYCLRPAQQALKLKKQLIYAMLSVTLLGTLLQQVEWTSPQSTPIKVALLQGNIAQDLKWSPDMVEHTLVRYLHMAEASDARLIVMPETALPMLSSNLPEAYRLRLQALAKKNNGAVLVGVIEHEHDQYFNSMLNVAGADSEVYRKSHLVPFGEFIPLKAVFAWIYRDWLNMPLSDLSRGSFAPQPMLIAGQKVAINICYEDVFGEEIVRQLPAATLLVNASNDAWYGQSIAADQHLQFSQARAMETGRTVLRATNTGATAMIDRHGRVLAQAPHFSVSTLSVMAQGYSGSTPYVRFANSLVLLLCLLGLLLIFVPNFLASRAKTK